ncbi:MAG: DNA repair protein RecN [Candidatus Zixiibacteriota bacterium]|nr:MAG: DNA repair protein RecN [candidate division Zixibacteria bacterium]
MIVRLNIENIALVEKAELTFEPGMSVLTGETGGGKSVIVTALSLALGDRAEREYVRAGEQTAVVEADFDVSTMPGQYRQDFSDYIIDNGFTVRREVNVSGSSRVKINGEVSSLTRLRELTAPVAEILGQHAGRMLMDEANHLLFLDRFASLTEQREELSRLFSEWQQKALKLRQMRSRREEMHKERELLLFQKTEIEKAEIAVGEEQQLLREKKILDSSRSLIESARLVQEMLDNDDSSALTYFRQARHELEKMAAIDEALKQQLSELTDIDYRLEELRVFIEQYGNSVPDNPDRLDEINARLDELYGLKRKYGDSEEAILETLADIRNDLSNRPDVSQHIADLEAECQTLRESYTATALSMSMVRHKAAEYLKKLVTKELADLAIDGAGFEFEFVYEDDPEGITLEDERTVKPRPHGLEDGRILFTANPGEPLKSLVKTASGGEISRLLLALKAAEKKNAKLSHSLLVFDEVDVGIGGQTANEVGKKLKGLSASCQLLVVTHLHQIARLAEHHYVARKEPKQDARTTIRVTKLGADSIGSELERMVALPE